MVLSSQGFQQTVGVIQAPAVEGDFATKNPRFNVPAGPGALVAGPNGVTVGRFCWWSSTAVDPENAPAVVNNTGSGMPVGLIAREMQGLNTIWLQESGMLIQPGFPVTAFHGGDFWVVNRGSTPATIGMKAYARFSDGAVQFAPTGSAATVSLTTSSIAAGAAFSGTGSISGNVLTIGTPTNTIVPGAILTGTGVATGTQITAQLSGTTGGAGTYAVSIPEQTVASTTISGTYGVLTVGGGGPPVSGSVLSGTGVTAGTTVWGQLTSTTWAVSPSQTAASTTITATTNIETKFYAFSAAAVGELIKISDHFIG